MATRPPAASPDPGGKHTPPDECPVAPGRNARSVAGSHIPAPTQTTEEDARENHTIPGRQESSRENTAGSPGKERANERAGVYADKDGSTSGPACPNGRSRYTYAGMPDAESGF